MYGKVCFLCKISKKRRVIVCADYILFVEKNVNIYRKMRKLAHPLIFATCSLQKCALSHHLKDRLAGLNDINALGQVTNGQDEAARSVCLA